MSATRPVSNKKSQNSKQNTNYSPKDRLKIERSSTSKSSSHVAEKNDFAFIRKQKLPAKIKVLLLLQKSSSSLAIILVAITALLYSWSFYVPQLWSKEYKKLETLQRYEREFIKINGTLKNQFARQATSKDAGLEPFDSERAIFVTPASQDFLSNSQKANTTDDRTSNLEFPLGY